MNLPHPNSATASRNSPVGRRMGILLLCSCLLAPALSIGQSDTYSQAEALIRAHRWEDGLGVLTPLLKAAPHNVMVLNLTGLALAGKGDIAQASEYFKKAITIDPRFVPALKNLSIAEFGEKQFSAAEKHLLAARDLAPRDQVVRLYLGEIDFQEHKYQHAIEELEAARELISRNPEARALLALSYLQTASKQPALEILKALEPESLEAKTRFDIVLALDSAGLSAAALPFLQSLRRQYPDSYEIGFDLMLVDLAAGSSVEAIQTGVDLIAHGHDSSELNNVLAEAYVNSREFQLAGETYKRAIALDPANEENYIDLASLCMNQQLLSAGMTVVETGLRTHPQSDRLIFMRGLLYAMQDEFELAEKDFKRSAALSPQKNLGYIGLGASYLETGHDEQAIFVLRQRLHEKPNDASLLYLLGEGLIHTGASMGSAAYREAQSALEKSTSLNPGLCLPHISLGTIYLDEDRNQEAAAQFEEARTIDPRERSAYSHLAVAYKKLGEAEKSKQVLAALKEVIEQERHANREKLRSEIAPSVDKQHGDNLSFGTNP